MKPFRIPLRIVFYKEVDSWVAHCLEFDLAGDGSSQDEALHSLCEAIAVQVEASVKYGCFDNLFTPADGDLFRKFAAGKNIAISELHLCLKDVDSVTIEAVEAREYSAPADTNSELVRA